MENFNIEQVQSDLKSYARTQYDLLRLNAVSSLSRLLGYLLLAICVILLLFGILSFAAFAAIGAMASCMPVWAACLVMVGVFVVLIVVVALMRKRLFINPFVKRLSGIFFAEDGRKAEEIRLREEAQND
jgi:hypothetical protein